MTYSVSDLETLFTNANEGVAPDASLNPVFAALTKQSVPRTDSQLLLEALHIDGSVGSNTPEDSTDVALAVYQFFTGSAPSLAGLDYLVNGGGNPNDLDSAVYAGFNQANRYYNFAINLISGNAAVAANFAAQYGSASFDQVVSAAYESIVGTPNVGAARAAAAIAAIEAQEGYFAQVAAERAPNVDHDLATKAIAVAYVLEEAIKIDTGYYASAIDQFDIALSAGGDNVPGETANGVDLLAGHTLTLTPGVDTITPSVSDKNTVVGNELTLNANDSINLGWTIGNVLNWVETTAHGSLITAVPPMVTVAGVQTANFAGADPLIIDTSGWSGLYTLNVVAGSGAAGASSVRALFATAVNLTDNQTADNVSGHYLTTTGGSVVTITANHNGFANGGAINVDGGFYGPNAITVNQTGGSQDVVIDDNPVVNNDYYGVNNSYVSVSVSVSGLVGHSLEIIGPGDAVPLDDTLLITNSVTDVYFNDVTGGGLGLTLTNAKVTLHDPAGASLGVNATLLGVDTLTLSAHSAPAIIDLTHDTVASFATPTAAMQTSVPVAGLDVVAGLGPGDDIILPANDRLGGLAGNLAGVGGHLVFAPGTLSGGAFTYGAGGQDALMTYDNGAGVFVSVVLVGVASDISHASLLASFPAEISL